MVVVKAGVIEKDSLLILVIKFVAPRALKRCTQESSSKGYIQKCPLVFNKLRN